MDKDKHIEDLKISIGGLNEIIVQIQRDKEQLLGALEAIKTSMELSESPFYKGMEMVNKTLSKFK